MQCRDRIDMLQRVIPPGGLSVEVGTFHGDYAAEILRHQKPDKLILIDDFRDYQDCSGELCYAEVQERFADEIASGQVEVWQGLSLHMIAQLEPQSVGFAYIDADHCYTAVLSDLQSLLPKMRPGGWLCGHDYCMCNNFGVVRAVAVFCERHGLRVNFLTDEPLEDWLKPSTTQPQQIAYNSFGIRIS